MIELRSRLQALAGDHAAAGDPQDAESLLRLLRMLYRVGREDLPLGRLFEGHVDALQIISRYGTAAQIGAIPANATLGVWNADLAGEALRLADDMLNGGKSFASGAGILSHALVTVDGDGGRQLVLLDLASAGPTVDRSFWRVAGMQRSETHVVRWRDVPVASDALVGLPGDYIREPWFSGGALRFVAVQAGGIARLVDEVRDHLVAMERATDPHQAGRLARLFGLAEASAAAVRRAAEGWFAEEPARLSLVAAARAATYAAGGEALSVAQEAVGVSALFLDHPLATTITDLSMYLRQPGPDAQRMQVGGAVASGVLRPML